MPNTCKVVADLSETRTSPWKRGRPSDRSMAQAEQLTERVGTVARPRYLLELGSLQLEAERWLRRLAGAQEQLPQLSNRRAEWLHAVHR